MIARSMQDYVQRFYRHLKAIMPPPRPVRLVWRPKIMFDGLECDGIIHWGPAGTATIAVSLRAASCAEAVVHEYAHVMANTHEHDTQWADAYGTVYRIWEQWNRDDANRIA